MKFAIQLLSVTAALAAALTLALHPAFGVLPSNPLAVVGVGLIGFGLIRRHYQGENDLPADA